MKIQRIILLNKQNTDIFPFEMTRMEINRISKLCCFVIKKILKIWYFVKYRKNINFDIEITLMTKDTEKNNKK